MKLSPKQISPERKRLYYIGMATAAGGFVLFLSNFIIMPMHAMNGIDPRDGGSLIGGFAFRGVGGFVLIAVGAGLMGVAVKGYAGSGVFLDPEQARKDLEPWNRMAGGMTDDALSEIGLVKKLENRLEEPPGETLVHVKVRCRTCQSLNDESAKFCSQCGGKM